VCTPRARPEDDFGGGVESRIVLEPAFDAAALHGIEELSPRPRHPGRRHGAARIGRLAKGGRPMRDEGRAGRTRAAARRGAGRRLAALALVAAVLALPGAAEAQRYTAARKFGRGLAAMTCGFLELPGNVVEVTRERGPAWGLTLGFAEGLGRIVVRELVGVYEFVSAPFPAPAGYRPILQPEYPWGYFE
jgi:putative exosortase-associated protein (TIGR04073 family)